MADIAGIDPTTNQPTSVPQEAAAEAYKSGKLKFNDKDRIPVKVGGVEGTMEAWELSHALEGGDAELNFDPHGTAKATAAGVARGATLGASDWLAVEGQRALGDYEGAEKTRQSLDALQKEHGTASMAGELAGAVLPSLIPGGAEVEASRLGATAAREAVAADSLLAGEQVAEATGATLREAGNVAKQAATTQAQTGVSSGSLLSKTLRNLNPYNAVGAGGSAVESVLTKALGGGTLAGVVAPVGRFAAEGLAIGAAGAADEAELGDYPLTGEALVASMEHGALWGSALGLIGVAGSKVLTAAGRMAGRLEEAQFGASRGQLERAHRQFGPGALGARYLEEGGSPFESAEEKYNRWAAINERDALHLDQLTRDYAKYGGVRAEDAYVTVQDAIKTAQEQHVLAGGNPQLGEKVLQEVRHSLGLQEMPEPPAPTLPHEYDAEYERMVEQGLKEGSLTPRDQIKRPRPPSKTAVEQRTKLLAKQAGADVPTTPDKVFAEQRRIQMGYRDLPLEQRGPAMERLQNPKLIQTELEAARMQAIERLHTQAAGELSASYSRDLNDFKAKNDAYGTVRQMAHEKVEDLHQQKTRDYNFLAEKVRKENAGALASFASARDLRMRLDKVIPRASWHSASSVDNAAVEIKKSARQALENAIEQDLDKAASKMGDEKALGYYVHAKQRYAQSKTITDMVEKGRARHANAFGRPSRLGGISGHVAIGAAAALTGHPLAGVVGALGYNAATHYGPKIAAWALSKASRLATLKAIRQELSIGTRRGIRGAMDTAGERAYAKVGVSELPAHELRLTAADAMAHVSKLAANPAALRGRLAALSPDTPVIAPNSFNAAEGAFRRQVLFLAAQIPHRFSEALARGEPVNPRDVSDNEAREFLENTAVVIDPRVATDAAANGTITSIMAKAHKGAWPASHNNAMLQYKRIVAMDRSSLDFLHPSKKNGLSALFSAGDPSFTLSLQLISQIGQMQPGQSAGGGPPSGMQHASATSKGMGAMVALQTTQAQAAEAGPPGRRGRKADGM